MFDNKHSKKLIVAPLIFLGLVIVSNYITTICGDLLIPLYTLDRDIAIYDTIPRNADQMMPITFMVPIILIIIYMWPMLLIGVKGSTLNDQVKGRLINAPFIIALIGMTGWLTDVFLTFLGSWVGQISINWDISIKVTMNAFFLGGLCFVISYYLLEYINRKYFIPTFFPEGRLEECKVAINLSVRSRFYIFFSAVSIFPLFLMTKIIIKIVETYQLSVSLIPIYAVVGVFFMIGMILTYLISGAYQSPLINMKQATKQIRSGNYEVNITVVTKDEFGSLGEGINDMTIGLKEKELIKDTFGKMVDPRVRDHLLKGNISLGGEIQNATILFTDIRGFSKICEKIPPKQIVEILNRFFEKMSTCITEESGLVNKFIGDAILAIFGAPIKHQNHAEDAIRAAVKMREACHQLNEEFKRKNFPHIKAGIGIHTGEVLAGNIGSASRMEYTVIGDTVNIASRLEKLCKEYKHDIILSETTVTQLKNPDNAKYLDQVTVRGREQAIKIFYQ